jgi:hypothetical protein
MPPGRAAQRLRMRAASFFFDVPADVRIFDGFRGERGIEQRFQNFLKVY